MNEYLLMEDDCAPDAREYFCKDLKEKFGLEFDDFINKGTRSDPDELTMEWRYKGYVLSFHGDDPFYKLDKDKDDM